MPAKNENFITPPTSDTKRRLGMIAIGAVFVFLCLCHYFSQRPLWLDEQCVYDNLVQKPLKEIFGPLLFGQTFPRAYLAAIKIVAQPFAYHLLAVRILPLLSMFGAFIVWSYLFAKNFSKTWQVLLAMALFAFSYAMLYYASELKPYSLDVLVVGLMTLFLTRYAAFENSRKTTIAVAAATFPFTILASYAGFFIAPILAYNLFLLSLRRRSLRPFFFTNLVLVVLCVLWSYRYDFRYGVENAGLLSYWKDYFIDFNHPGQALSSFWEGFRKMVVWWFGGKRIFWQAASGLILPMVVAMVMAFRRYFQRKDWLINTIDAIFWALFLELVILAILRKYPFVGERITLFMAPYVFFMIVCGVTYLIRIPLFRWAYTTFFALFLALCLGAASATFLTMLGQSLAARP